MTYWNFDHSVIFIANCCWQIVKPNIIYQYLKYRLLLSLSAQGSLILQDNKVTWKSHSIIYLVFTVCEVRSQINWSTQISQLKTAEVGRKKKVLKAKIPTIFTSCRWTKCPANYRHLWFYLPCPERNESLCDGGETNWNH